MQDVSDVYKGNDANDFQPVTQNPQGSQNSDLQQPTNSSLQPVSTQTDGSQQGFPTVEQLRVYGVESDNSSETNQQTRTAEESNNNVQGSFDDALTMFGSALVLVAIIFAFLVWLAVKKSKPNTIPEETKKETNKDFLTNETKKSNTKNKKKSKKSKKSSRSKRKKNK